MKKNNFKIKPRKIDSSDCVVYIGQVIEGEKIVDKGEAIPMHENEWVEIIPVMTMKESFALMKIANITDTSSDADKSLEEVCVALSNRVVDWNWTGIDGEELEKPYKNSNVFKNLYNEELIWLITTSTGETKTERKNESRLSPNTPLAEGLTNQVK